MRKKFWYDFSVRPKDRRYILWGGGKRVRCQPFRGSSMFYFISTEIYPHRWQWWNNRSVFSLSQSATRTMKFQEWKIIVRGVWLDEPCFSLVKSDRTASHVILGAKPGKPPFYFQDVGKVCGRRFSWQFYCRTRKQSHVTKNTTRCKTFANLFRNQEWT